MSSCFLQKCQGGLRCKVDFACRIVQCPDLSHLHMETRRKLQRSYDEGETARADKFLERLRCLRCGGLDHFLVSCPELAFLSKDDRWDVAALYKAGQVQLLDLLNNCWPCKSVIDHDEIS